MKKTNVKQFLVLQHLFYFALQLDCSDLPHQLVILQQAAFSISFQNSVDSKISFQSAA